MALAPHPYLLPACGEKEASALALFFTTTDFMTGVEGRALEEV